MKIGERILIKRIDDSVCQKALGIVNVQLEFDTDGRINKTMFHPDSRMWFRDFMPDFHDPNLKKLMRLNFVLIVDSVDDAAVFQQALRLLDHHIFTGINIGFSRRPNGDTKYYIHPKLYSGRTILELTDANIKTISNLMEALSGLKSDSKLSIVLEKYLYALSSDGLSFAHRFLDLAIVLEMMLLPENGLELSYKFRLRFANLFKKMSTKYSNNDIKHLYATGKTIYNIRSKIVHTGTANDIKENLESLKDFAKEAILLYLHNKNFFAEKKLDELCL